MISISSRNVGGEGNIRLQHDWSWPAKSYNMEVFTVEGNGDNTSSVWRDITGVDILHF